MIKPATARSGIPHLMSALIAYSIVIAILCSGRMLAIHLERKTVHWIAPKDFFIKNQGLAFERAAARRPDILLLYGSSELIDPIPNRACDFFASAPTGFQVCPVGKAGATSLIILQKLGALGSELRGRKVAISLSASSFLTPTVRPDFYAGNFSSMAASNVLFGNAIDFNLKAAIAKRMLQFPNTLAEDGLVELAARCFASDRSVDRIILMGIWPLGKLENAMLDLQDHFEALVYILAEGRRIRIGCDRTIHKGCMHPSQGIQNANHSTQSRRGETRRFGRGSLPRANGRTWSSCFARLRSLKLTHSF